MKVRVAKEWNPDRVAIYSIDTKKRLFTEKLYRLTIEDKGKVLSRNKRYRLMDALVSGNIENMIDDLSSDYSIAYDEEEAEINTWSEEALRILYEGKAYDFNSPVELYDVSKENYNFLCSSKNATLVIAKRKNLKSTFQKIFNKLKK